MKCNRAKRRLTLRIGCAVARKKTFITNKDEGK
jgi:hypothetical protein